MAKEPDKKAEDEFDMCDRHPSVDPIIKKMDQRRAQQGKDWVDVVEPKAKGIAEQAQDVANKTKKIDPIDPDIDNRKKEVLKKANDRLRAQPNQR